jgi:hypothetical protein
MATVEMSRSKAPGVIPFFTASSTQFRGAGPQVARRRQHWQESELLLQLNYFLVAGVSQDLKCNRFGQHGIGSQNVGSDELLKSPWRARTCEVDPEAAVDQRRH